MSGEFTHALRVRYSECDAQGIVFNANYFTYFDVALTELWREAVGPYGEMAAGGVDMVVAEAGARYRASASFDDMLEIAVAVTRLGTTSLGTAMAVRRGSTVVVEGEMRHVFIDLGTRAKVEMPDHIRRGLEPYAVRGEAEAWSISG